VSKSYAILCFILGIFASAISFAPSAAAADVTLTYNSNVTQHQIGVVSSGAVPSPAVYAQNATVTVSENSGRLSRQGFTFGGWNTATDGSGTNYTAGSGTFTITANTNLYAKWIIPSSARLIGSTGLIKTLNNNNNQPNYTGICNSGIYGITSDGTYIYFRTSSNYAYICKIQLDGTFVSSHLVANISPAPALSTIEVSNRDLTFSSGCIWLRATGEIADSDLYCISVSDWTMRKVATPSGKGLLVGSFWLYGNLIDFPDGRIGAVSAGSATLGATSTDFGGTSGTTPIACPSNMYCKILRLYKPTGTGAAVSLSFSEDIVLADNTKETTGALTGWPNDDHGIATDGTYLYQIKYNSGYKVWALASGSASYLVFNGSGTGTCGAGTGVSGTLCRINNPLVNATGTLGNATFFGHNHITNQYIMSDIGTSKFYISASDTPPAGPGSATGLSSLTISAGTLSPSFNSALAIYSDTLTASTSSLTVTPTALDVVNATIKVKVNSGTYATVTSGSASGALSLNVGMNTVYIQVTGADLTSVVTAISVFRPENPTITLTPSYSNTTKTYLDTLTVSISTSVYSPTGTFLFTENGTAISGCSAVSISTGIARCNWTPSTTGSKSVGATYSGDANVVLRSDTQTVTVNDVVSLTSNAAAISQKYGSSRTTKAVTYTGGSDTRTVSATFTSLASGKITFDTTTALFTIDTRTAVGTYYDTITVTDVRGSTASYMQTITITVADTLTVTSDTLTVTYGGGTESINPAMSAVSGLISGDVVSGATYNYTNIGGTTYGPVTVKPTNAGTYTITPSDLTFSSGAASNYAAITYRTSTLTINKAAQAALSVVSLYQPFYSNPTSTTLLATGGSDNGAVSYTYVPSLSTAGGCALSGANNSIITVTSEGTCRIVATKAETDNYLAAVSDTGTVTFHFYISNFGTPRAQEYPSEIVLVGGTDVVYQAETPPVISSASETTQAEGGLITLTGSGFTGTTSVKIKGLIANFVVNSDTSLTLTVPTGLAGRGGRIVVENAKGISISETLFTFTAPASI
jgi:hypothetical protein